MSGKIEERRRIRNPNGRRIDDRRVAVETNARPLPRALRGRGVHFATATPQSEKRAAIADSLRLVVRFQAGDPDAFRPIYERHFDGVYGYLLTAFRDRHEAEDGAQEIFIRVLRALPQYQFRGAPFEAWLYRIVRNHTLNVKQRSAPVSPTDPASIDLWRDRRDDRLSSSSGSDDSDRHLLVFVERLPPSQRQVLVLRYMVGLDWGDIAAVLGRTTGAVRQLEQRALSYLRTRLEATERKPSPRTRSLAMRRLSSGSPVATSRRRALLAGARVA